MSPRAPSYPNPNPEKQTAKVTSALACAEGRHTLRDHIPEWALLHEFRRGLLRTCPRCNARPPRAISAQAAFFAHLCMNQQLVSGLVFDPLSPPSFNDALGAFCPDSIALAESEAEVFARPRRLPLYVCVEGERAHTPPRGARHRATWEAAWGHRCTGLNRP